MGSDTRSPTEERPPDSPMTPQQTGAADSAANAAPDSPADAALPLPHQAASPAKERGGDTGASTVPDTAAKPATEAAAELAGRGDSDAASAEPYVAPAAPDAAQAQQKANGFMEGVPRAEREDDDLSDLGSVYQGSDDGGAGDGGAGSGSAGPVRADAPDGAEPGSQQLQQALARILQLEDQNIALWQVRSLWQW